MNYRATHLKSGDTSIVSADKVRSVQENGFGDLFSFEAVPEAKDSELADWQPIMEGESDEIHADASPKGKKSAK